MAKSISKYICQQCGYSQVGWAGKCPQCGTWGSLVETLVETGNGKIEAGSKKSATPIPLSKVPPKSIQRVSTKISELDRVLGGGIVPGQVILIAGEPGIGKSTLLLQVSENMAKTGVFYVSGEESVYQIKIRADRLKIKSEGVTLMEETDIDAIINTISNETQKPALLIIDSIQTMTTGDLTGLAGSVGQVRESAFRLIKLAKSRNIPTFIVGHVTKEGTVAGPSVLMHMVDSVLWFEGDKTLTTRMIRAVKNRFGPTDEVGLFTMEDKGLVPIDDPEKLFLSEDTKNVPGVCVATVMQGTRPVLVEIQALTVPTKMAFPKRVAQGIDSKRYELLLAVLAKRCGVPVLEQDCYLNVAGGINLSRDPSVDLAICLATASAAFNKSLPIKTVAIGEVGLLGDVRSVVAQEKRIKETRRLGYKNLITSEKTQYLNSAINLLKRNSQ